VDPEFFISNYSGTPGSTLSIYVTMKVNAAGGAAYNSDDIVFYFNSEIFTVTNVVTAGSTDPNSLWTSVGGANEVSTSSNIDNADGYVIIGQYWQGSNPPTFADGKEGDLVEIEMKISSAAPTGTSTPLNLGANKGPSSTQFNGSYSALNPAPTNAPNDPVDGKLTVLASVSGGSIPVIDRLLLNSINILPLQTSGINNMFYEASLGSKHMGSHQEPELIYFLITMNPTYQENERAVSLCEEIEKFSINDLMDSIYWNEI
jgi:hypothetical protein